MSLYTLQVTAPSSRPRVVWFSAPSLADAARVTQALSRALTEADRVRVVGPSPVLPGYARWHCIREGRTHAGFANETGCPCLDPWLLGEADYRAAYRAARVEAVGYGGLAPDEEAATLPF